MTKRVLLTTCEAARILGCTPDNVRRLARIGRLRVSTYTTFGMRLFAAQDVESLKQARQVPGSAAPGDEAA